MHPAFPSRSPRRMCSSPAPTMTSIEKERPRRSGAKVVEMGCPDRSVDRYLIGRRPLALGHHRLRVFADWILADRILADWSLANRRRRRRRLLARQIGGGGCAQH